MAGIHVLTVDHGPTLELSKQKNNSNLLRLYLPVSSDSREEDNITDNIFALDYFVRIFVNRFQICQDNKAITMITLERNID